MTKTPELNGKSVSYGDWLDEQPLDPTRKTQLLDNYNAKAVKIASGGSLPTTRTARVDVLNLVKEVEHGLSANDAIKRYMEIEGVDPKDDDVFMADIYQAEKVTKAAETAQITREGSDRVAKYERIIRSSIGRQVPQVVFSLTGTQWTDERATQLANIMADQASIELFEMFKNKDQATEEAVREASDEMIRAYALSPDRLQSALNQYNNERVDLEKGEAEKIQQDYIDFLAKKNPALAKSAEANAIRLGLILKDKPKDQAKPEQVPAKPAPANSKGSTIIKALKEKVGL